MSESDSGSLEEFHAQSWEQRLDLIRGNHAKEMEDLLLFERQHPSVDVLWEERLSFALLDGFWQKSGVDVRGCPPRPVWGYLTDRLSRLRNWLSCFC